MFQELMLKKLVAFLKQSINLNFSEMLITSLKKYRKKNNKERYKYKRLKKAKKMSNQANNKTLNKEKPTKNKK